jgi:hypothetical protein
MLLGQESSGERGAVGEWGALGNGERGAVGNGGQGHGGFHSILFQSDYVGKAVWEGERRRAGRLGARMPDQIKKLIFRFG